MFFTIWTMITCGHRCTLNREWGGGEGIKVYNAMLTDKNYIASLCKIMYPPKKCEKINSLILKITITKCSLYNDGI
jgi:hypothetical protein